MRSRHVKASMFQRGVALAYILATIALASLAATYIAKSQRGVAQSQFNQDVKNSLTDPYTISRSRISGCAITYPAGNNGTGFHLVYPATPASGLVADLTCPGQSGSNNLWYGTGGLTFAAQHRSFLPWRYVNDATNIRITITAAVANNPTLQGIMDVLVQRIGASASRSGDVLTIILLA